MEVSEGKRKESKMKYQVWVIKSGNTLSTIEHEFGTMEEAIAFINTKGLTITYEGVCFSDADIYFFDCE